MLLQGYASVLAEVARVAIDNRVSMPPTLLGVYATAEVLNDVQRQRIQQAFGYMTSRVRFRESFGL